MIRCAFRVSFKLITCTALLLINPKSGPWKGAELLTKALDVPDEVVQVISF
jgi:hypothetical protein